MLAATIGVFDGVHRGHRFLIRTLCDEAAARGLEPAVVVIHPSNLSRITTDEEQNKLLNSLGITHILRFDLDDIHQLTAQEFLTLLQELYHVTFLLMGYDHRFGSDLLTYEQIINAPWLNTLHLNIRHCTPYTEHPTFSSSAAREAITAGDIERANEILGHPYTLTGTVVHGNAIGRTIGFPTANILPPHDKLLPPPGVYNGLSTFDFERSGHSTYPALINIGSNPTVGNDHTTIEAYLPDYHGDNFYDQTMTVSLTKRIREERHFGSLEQLKAQITQDVASIR